MSHLSLVAYSKSTHRIFEFDLSCTRIPLAVYSHSIRALFKCSSLYPESWSTTNLPWKLLWNKVIQLVIKPCITVNTCYLVYLCQLKLIKHRALDFAQHRALLCYNYVTYCLFELVSCAKQENLLWSNVSFILHELQLLVRSHAFCWVSSKIKKCNFEMKKPSRQTILVHTIALHGESFHCAAVFTEYELLMQISKSTRHALDSYPTRTWLVLDSKISSECDVTLELYRSYTRVVMAINCLTM